jgi:hypothetical protein
VTFICEVELIRNRETDDVLYSQMTANVHGQKIVNVVNCCSYTEGTFTLSRGEGILQRCSVCTGKFLW